MKKLLTLVLTLTLLLTAIPVVRSNAAVFYKYQIDDNYYIQYSINNNEITIERDSEGRDVVIPSEIDGYPVTKIADLAFKGCDKLRSIYIPDSVKYIGNNAFNHCTSLEEVRLPNGITSIGESAFFYCRKLTEIDIPTSVTTIGDNAFNSTSLKEIVIPDSVTSIGIGVFSSCISLTSVTMPEKLTYLGANVFSYCNTLESIIIPEGITTLPNRTFDACECLKEVVLPSTLTAIGDSAFAGCVSMTFPEIPEGVTYIGPNAFRSGHFTEVFLPKSIKEIGYNIFSYCYSLKTINYYGSEEDWNNININEKNEIIGKCTIVYDYAPSFKVTINGNESFIKMGETVTLTADPYTFDEATQTMLIFAGWNVSGVEISNTDKMEISFIVPENEVTITEKKNVHGDANGDGSVDMKDSLAVKKHAADITKDHDYDILMDANLDGIINAKDLLIVKKIIAGVYQYN